MFNRLFGKKKNDDAASSEQVKEPEKSAQDKAIESMTTIKNTIRDLEAKVKLLTETCDKNLKEAAELKKKNDKDPRIKQLLLKVKKDRENIQKYNAVIIKQESNLTAIDDAAFIAEMYEVMEKTRDAMKSAVDGINDKMRDLMDELEDRKQDIAEVMDLLVTNDAEEEDLDDIADELDKMIADEANQLPSVPSTEIVHEALPDAPTHEAQQPETDDLDSMLAELDNI